MICVSQNDPGAKLLQLPGLDSFDCALSTDRHEYRGRYLTVISLESARPRTAVGM